MEEGCHSKRILYRIEHQEEKFLSNREAQMKTKLFILTVILISLSNVLCKGPAEEPEETGKKATEKVVLRSQPTELSQNDVIQMIKDKGLHCPGEKINGTLQHQYEVQTLGEQIVIVDQTTGLMWQQTESERMDWKEAEAYVEQCNADQYAGFSDWRLPTVEELASLLEPKKKNGNYIDPVFQKDLLSTWTCDTIPEAFAGAWFVDFSEGKPTDGNRAAGMGQVRLVRSR